MRGGGGGGIFINPIDFQSLVTLAQDNILHGNLLIIVSIGGYI